MSLLHAGVDTAVIALWLGHADIRSTNTYLHADMTIKQRALDATTPAVDTARPLPAHRQAPGLPRKPVIMPTPPATHPPRSPPTTKVSSTDRRRLGIVTASG